MQATAPNPFQIAAGLFEQGAAVRAKAWTPEPYQRRPDGAWRYWLLVAGRGTGKSDTGSFDMVRHVREDPPCLRGPIPHRMSIIAPTLGDAVEACWKAPAGISVHEPRARIVQTGGGTIIRFPGGSEAKLFGAFTPDDVERLRAGGNRCRIWAEELAAWRYLDEAWDQAMFGLRLGPDPRVVVTTTPKPRKKLKELLADPRSVRALTADGRIPTTDDNPHLPEDIRRELYKLFGGTRKGRQELGGEMLDDVPGALWRRETLDVMRVREHPDLVRVVVAVDPEATSSEDSAETGILVVGMGIVPAHPVTDPALAEAHPPVRHLHGFVLEDATLRGTPREWGSAAVTAYHRNRADLIVGEVNNGGEMVEFVIRTVDQRVPFKAVHASRGKAIRAEPVSSLYEQLLVSHVGEFPMLEDQLCEWVPGEGDSPDRLDAVVWGFTELAFESLEIPAGSSEPEERISPL
ncbi:MAG: terminase family protein [Chloroflexota bacterium]